MANHTVGDIIDAYCPKCVSVQPHAIVALKGTRVSRTDCKTCDDVHAYRKNPPGTKMSAASREAAVKRNQYEKALEGRDTSKAIKYKTTQKFKEDDLLDHKTFGVGVVTRILTPNKMEVAFPNSTKLLVFNR